MITVAVINEDLGIKAWWDRIVVLEDEVKSGMECSACKGVGNLGVKCPDCNGTKAHRGRPESGWECDSCMGGKGSVPRPMGFVPCELCSGRTTSTIIIPDDAETKPTTGTIQSIGQLCGYIKLEGAYIKLPDDVCLHIGDRVVFQRHSGHLFELGKKSEFKVRIIKESEVLCTTIGGVGKPISPEINKELAEVGIK